MRPDRPATVSNPRDRAANGWRRGEVVRALLGAGALAGFGVASRAAAFPDKPVTLVLPVPPGSSSDLVARAMAAEAARTLGQPVVTENRPGAHGVVGLMGVRNARPDGYTVGMANVGAMAVTPWLYKRRPYDPLRDFQPITLGWAFPSVLFVAGTSPVKTVAELVASLRGKSGSYASQGPGSGGHLLAEQFRQRSGLELVHVPYKGSMPALQDLMAGRVDFCIDGASIDKAQWVQEGRLRAIAIASRERSPLFPGVPTLAESGFDGIEMDVWFGFVGPAGLPEPLVRTLNEAFVQALAANKATGRQQGFTVYGSTPQAFAARIAADVERFGPVVRATGITID